MTGKANLAASVLARLLNRAKQTGDDYQTLLSSYCIERFLFRLGASNLRNRFLLKGAMLLHVWTDQTYRATRDLDLLRRGEGNVEAIGDDIRAIIVTSVPPDAVDFDGSRIRLEPIRAEDEYVGTRAMLPARCGTARLMIQIDMGLGDAVWPAPWLCSYPTLLDLPAPEVFAYPREAVVAEKLEAIVVLGNRNSRIKDYFDLHHLASRFTFDRATLAEAVRRTFERRNTPIPSETPIGLTLEYWENPLRPAQVRAFARRAGLKAPENPADLFMGLLEAFLSPLLEDLRLGTRREGTWPPGGTWR